MKLRNKNTGEIIDVGCRTSSNGDFWITRDNHGTPIYINFYSTLTELNEEWEDYVPKEPLITDKKIRKAVRAWAEANSLRCDDKVEARTPTVDCCVLGLTHGFTSIDVIVNEETSLKDYSRYTIEELCGEEE